LELLKAALDRLQGYYFLGISHLFDLLTDPNKACGQLWSVLRYRVGTFLVPSDACRGTTSNDDEYPNKKAVAGPENM
jgi:hypothetical protein